LSSIGGHGVTLQSSITYTRDAGDRVSKAVDSLAGTINRSYDGLNDLTQDGLNHENSRIIQVIREFDAESRSYRTVPSATDMTDLIA
jgi:hypothetical protein